MNQFVHCRGVNYSLFNYDWTVNFKYIMNLLYHILFILYIHYNISKVNSKSKQEGL